MLTPIPTYCRDKLSGHPPIEDLIIFYLGSYFFWDETRTNAYGPFKSMKEAKVNLNTYIKENFMKSKWNEDTLIEPRTTPRDFHNYDSSAIRPISIREQRAAIQEEQHGQEAVSPTTTTKSSQTHIASTKSSQIHYTLTVRYGTTDMVVADNFPSREDAAMCAAMDWKSYFHKITETHKDQSPQSDKEIHRVFMRKEVDTILALMAGKNADYTSGGGFFSNFEKGERIGIPRMKSLYLRMQDKTARIESFFTNGKLQDEGLEDAFRDLIGYSLLALAMLEEDRTKDKEKKA